MARGGMAFGVRTEVTFIQNETLVVHRYLTEVLEKHGITPFGKLYLTLTKAFLLFLASRIFGRMCSQNSSKAWAIVC